MRLLAEHCPVDVICLGARRARRGGPLTSLPSSVGIRTLESPRAPGWSPWLPFLAKKAAARELVRVMSSLGQPGDALWISRNAPDLTVPRRLGLKIIGDAHGVADARGRQRARLSRADMLLVGDGHEAERIRAQGFSASVQVIPDPLDPFVFELANRPRGNSILFLGALDDLSGIEDLRRFLAEAAPRLRSALRERMPRIVVSGRTAPRAFLRQLMYEGIETHVLPPTLLPLLADAGQIVIVGRAAGARVTQAMGSGRPVIRVGRATSDLPGTIAVENPEEAHMAILELLESETLRRELGEAGTAAAKRECGEAVSRERISRLLSSLIGEESSDRGVRADLT